MSNVATNGRETISAEQISRLNMLDWDEKHYANCSGNGEDWLEVTYRLGDGEYRYRINCPNYRAVELLRHKLDENTKMTEDGHIVEKR